MNRVVKRGSGVLVMVITLLAVILAFASPSEVLDGPMPRGVYYSESIKLDPRGDLGFLRMSGVFQALDMELEYKVERTGMEVRIFSGNTLMEAQRLNLTVEDNMIVLENGTRIQVEETENGYALRYPDHTVIVRRK